MEAVPRQFFDSVCQSGDAKTMRRFLTPCFVARKAFNHRGLQFRFPSYLVGYLVALCGCASKSEVVDFDCCHNRWTAQVLTGDA